VQEQAKTLGLEPEAVNTFVFRSDFSTYAFSYSLPGQLTLDISNEALRLNFNDPETTRNALADDIVRALNFKLF
jgi:hypothetical protein